MKIFIFLKPKGECVYVYDEDSLREVLDVMEAHRFASIPMISKSTGAYKGTITEGDLLWYIKNQHNLNLHSAKDIRIKDIKRHRDNQPVSVGAKMEDLFSKAVQQNFVPVIDGQKCFIGIITRKNIIEYLCEKTEKK